MTTSYPDPLASIADPALRRLCRCALAAAALHEPRDGDLTHEQWRRSRGMNALRESACPILEKMTAHQVGLLIEEVTGEPKVHA